MKVKCVDDFASWLTYGKEYQVIRTLGEYFEIEDDFGVIRCCCKYSFNLVYIDYKQLFSDEELLEVFCDTNYLGTIDGLKAVAEFAIEKYKGEMGIG